MATKTAEKTKGKEVTKPKGGAVGTHDPALLKMMQEDKGKGVSTDVSDNIVPLVYILQANSPGLDRQNKDVFLGKEAKAGDIWLRGTKMFAAADPEEDEPGMTGVPCYFSKVWIEWRPDRGGFVARHAQRPKDAKLQSEKRDEGDGTRDVWRLPGGNSVQETREYVFMVTEFAGEPLAKPRPYVIPMTSTNHTPGREWMSLINEQVIPGSNDAAPIYAFEYRIRTKHRVDGDNSWYVYSITDAGEEDGASVPKMVSDLALYHECRRICERFKSGEMKADAPEEDGLASERGGGDNSDM